MTAVKSLAKGRIKLTALPERPADPDNITLAELAAGVDISPFIALSDFALGSTGSDKTDDPGIEDEGNFKALEGSNYDGSISPFRYFDPETGLVDEEADVAFQMVKDKGTPLFLAKRHTAKKSTAPWTIADEVSYYEAQSDTPQVPAGASGYIKAKVSLNISAAHEFRKVVAGA
jgi:hypothetical protein